MENEFNKAQLTIFLAVAIRSETSAVASLKSACQNYINEMPSGLISNEMALESALDEAISWQGRVDLIKRAQGGERTTMRAIGSLPFGWAHRVLIDHGQLR